MPGKPKSWARALVAVFVGGWSGERSREIAGCLFDIERWRSWYGETQGAAP